MPTVYSLPWFFQQFCDGNGAPLAGGYIETKYAGTSDDKATYSDAAGTTPYDNPIDLDASGMPDAGPIFLQAGPYDFYVYDSDDNLIATLEGINALNDTANVDTLDDLRALAAGETPVVKTLGYSAINDGGGWWYYWNATSTATDDGGGVIQPDSLPATGRWLALIPANREMNVRVFGATCDGSTDDIDELQACDDWCAANGCIILIDSNIYVASDPELASKIKLLPSAQFRFGIFSPTLDVIIDGNDKTQHFNCAVGINIPVLNINEMYPEWFGEDSTTHPIMTSVISSLTDEKTKYLRSVDIGGDLSVSGPFTFDDTVEIDGVLTLNSELNADAGADIEGAVDIAGDVNLQSGTDDCLVIGADVGATTKTDNTEKVAMITAPGYDTDEENTTILKYDNAVGNATVYIGGSDPERNAATKVGFYTAANSVTLQGTERGSFSSGGVFSVAESIVVGDPTMGARGTGTINAEAVYDDNFLLTGYVLDKAFNPDFSLEKWNKITRGRAEEFDKRANIMLNIDNYSKFIEENRVLPTFEEIEKNERQAPTGEMVQKLWEVVEIQSVHIKQLNDKLNKINKFGAHAGMFNDE